MTFREMHVTQLSSPTTCYTGLKNGSSLASATHVIEINESRQQVQAIPIQLPSSKFSCVGYTCRNDDQVYCVLRDEEITITVEIDGPTILSTANESVTNASRRQGASGTNPLNDSGANLCSEESPTTTKTFRAALIWQRIDQKELKLPMSTRPLTPHLSSDGLLWVGSADNCHLNCYRRTEQEIIQLDFPESTTAYSFTSPIMGIASTALPNDQQCLAIGCQDGTLSLVEFSIKAGVQHGKAHTVIVDGPIMSLDFFIFMDEDELQVLVGSMCGYICRLTRISNTWHGPDLIVDDLWNGDSDDAVLAVCGMTRNRIAVGTHSGWLYIISHCSGVLLWKCLLSYAIHSVVQDGNKLVVTTKRTLHVFEEQSVPDVLCSASLARERLEFILAEQTSRNKTKDDGPIFVDESKVVSLEAPVRDKMVAQQEESNQAVTEIH